MAAPTNSKKSQAEELVILQINSAQKPSARIFPEYFS
jgi:hypothetical protein